MTSVWTAHKNSNVTRYDKNFKQTNKLALKTRATTARAQSAFRKTYSKHLPRFVKEIPVNHTYLPEEAHPYGRPNRPGTPVGDVVSNFYGENAEKVITQKYDILKETTKPLSLSYARGHTRASAMAKSHITQDNFNKSYVALNDKELFKMTKFKNVKPRTDTNNRSSTQMR